MRKILLLLTFLLVVWALPGAAQVARLLPANGKLGELIGEQPYPFVQINRKMLRLAPGGVIIDENNRFLVHGALPASAQVLFVLDIGGDVSRIILLTPEELMRIRQAAKQ